MQTDNAFIVDSFTDQPFKGNPAGVIVCQRDVEPDYMQSIATELNFSETAFVSPLDSAGKYNIRFFSPLMEIPLCGHATLAASKVLFEWNEFGEIDLRNIQGLQLPIRRLGSLIEMAFPVYDLEPANPPDALLNALGIEQISYCGFNPQTEILMLEIESTDELVDLRPDFGSLLRSHDSINGVLVTAVANDEFDFYSRYFWPWSGANEDPVTGATHTFLANYWSQKLGKTKMKSFQASQRTGHMEVEITHQNKLLIRGSAVVIFSGKTQV